MNLLQGIFFSNSGIIHSLFLLNKENLASVLSGIIVDPEDKIVHKTDKTPASMEDEKVKVERGNSGKLCRIKDIINMD